MAGRRNLWKDAFAFLLLISAAIVVLLVLRVTFLQYGSFPRAGRIAAWLITVGSLVALASLGLMILRLYVSPILSQAHARRKRNA